MRRADRIVQPLALGFWGRVWTLIAWCETREDFRMFRVDRISAIGSKGRFRPDPTKSLKTYLARKADRIG